MTWKDFLTRFVLLFIYASVDTKFPFQFNRDFFISGPIGVHYLALKTFK